MDQEVFFATPEGKLALAELDQATKQAQQSLREAYDNYRRGNAILNAFPEGVLSVATKDKYVRQGRRRLCLLCYENRDPQEFSKQICIEGYPFCDTHGSIELNHRSIHPEWVANCRDCAIFYCPFKDFECADPKCRLCQEHYP